MKLENIKKANDLQCLLHAIDNDLQTIEGSELREVMLVFNKTENGFTKVSQISSIINYRTLSAEDKKRFEKIYHHYLTIAIENIKVELLHLKDDVMAEIETL